jgi:hypothetical protein
VTGQNRLRRRIGQAGFLQRGGQVFQIEFRRLFGVAVLVRHGVKGRREFQARQLPRKIGHRRNE